MGWRGAAVSVVLLTRSSGSLGRLMCCSRRSDGDPGLGSPSGLDAKTRPARVSDVKRRGRGGGEELGGGFRDPRPSEGAGG